MNFYTYHFLSGLLAIILGVVAFSLEPFLGRHWAFFVAAITVLSGFIIIPCLYEIIKKPDGSADVKTNIMLIILAAICILLVGLAAWVETI